MSAGRQILYGLLLLAVSTMFFESSFGLAMLLIVAGLLVGGVGMLRLFLNR